MARRYGKVSDKITTHLRKHGRITQRELLEKFGVWDSHTMIKKLRNEGWDIVNVPASTDFKKKQKHGSTYVLEIDQRENSNG